MNVRELPLPPVEPDRSDGPPSSSPASDSADRAFARAVANTFGDASRALQRADAAERAFASGRGGMQEMVLERAQANIALSIASAAASRTAQSLSTILSMQI
ncbi:MAG: hypothetical protein NVSMB21_10120 [Vulcanimicrobiaceae bacterium]